MGLADIDVTASLALCAASKSSEKTTTDTKETKEKCWYNIYQYPALCHFIQLGAFKEAMNPDMQIWLHKHAEPSLTRQSQFVQTYDAVFVLREELSWQIHCR